MIETKNLRLRQWQSSDYSEFAMLNADSEVMKYFPNTLSTEESHQLAVKCQQKINKNGWGVWVVELKQQGKFIGVVGLQANEIESGLPNTPMTEIVWRLAKPYWGKGYATEAANATVNFAFQMLNLNNLYAFTALVNKPSIAVMERIGMHNTQKDFLHPKLSNNHRLAWHCLYAIDSNDYRGLNT